MAQSEAMHQKALDLHEALGSKEGMANDYGNLGNIYRTRGDGQNRGFRMGAMTKTARHLALAIGLVGVGSTAQAELIDAGNGLVDDTVLNICWVANAGLSGAQTWDNLVEWAADLDYGGYDDWRLASMSVAGGLPTGSADAVVNCETASEEACRDNELGYMYTYYLPGDYYGVKKTGSQTVGSVTLTGIHDYNWSGTAENQDHAYSFSFAGGATFSELKNINPFYGWAVRSGQCRAVPESVPAVGALGLGLLLAGVARSRLR